MNALFIVARTIHYAATMLLFGELAFASFVAVPTHGTAPGSGVEARGKLDRHLCVYTAFALAASVLTGIGWLVVEAVNMSGVPIGPQFPGTLAIVLGQTEFGHVVMARGVLATGLVVALVAMWYAKHTDTARIGRAVALLLGALYLAALAGEGHAAGETGTTGVAHLVADACHLLAAGGWLGALPPLVLCLGASPSDRALGRLARRFSVLGITCVGLLIASGIVNTLLLVGSFAALFGTPYGRLLVAKLALFALMLAIAATNRLRWTPALATTDVAHASRVLRRNAMAEIGFGVAIVAIVGVLGTMVPGAHQSPVWPLPFMLDFSWDELTLGARLAFVASLAIVIASLALIVVGVRRQAIRIWVSGCVVLLGSATASASILAVPAFPTTYAMSPVPYTAAAVLRGAAYYAQYCASCHGVQARGDGPLATSLPIRPPDLSKHALHHPPGNLFWWIAHGIANTPMPAFSPKRSDAEIWAIVQFLIVRASAQVAMSIGPAVSSASMSRVPDFTYEAPGQPQSALADGKTPALIVLYSLPRSTARLQELAQYARSMEGKLRVIAIAKGPPATRSEPGLVHAIVDRDVARVYAMFASDAAHVELLVDGAGVVRARWVGVDANGAKRDDEISAAVKALPKTMPMAMSMHHGH
ncbi:MAG TPA: copper homeostasis membrane protein CopD [Casimicrobiaceae bacterium]|nr:copper homeostasis membrane protein CopD [Casimicrobiaceae bacterium]